MYGTNTIGVHFFARGHDEREGRRMRRRATSILEVEQVQRVSALLGDLGAGPGQRVIVTTANGKTHAGKLLSHHLSSTLTRRDEKLCYYGSIELETDAGKSEINYLDIVWIAPAASLRHLASSRTTTSRSR